jgi:hypothetical protein
MDLPALVCRYADRFAALGGEEHHVASPLGAWLVLALAAPAATGPLAEQITDALGTDADSAHRAATELLASPHPSVAAAAAAWMGPELTGLDQWRARLPGTVTTGPVPTQQQADAWAREHTLGLIDTFPLDLARAVIVLASALATRVTWVTPFDLADAAELRGRWSTQLARVLRSPRDGGHHAVIAQTARAGQVAVHHALADDLEVTCVIAAADVPAVDVLAAAHEIATARVRHGQVPGSVSLFDLPLGEHPLWAITETQAPARGEHVEALLPAWHARSKHDLLAVPGLAFGAAGESLRRLADVPGYIEAWQSAVARYSRRGFEAAAVTVLAVMLSARQPPPPGPYRTATVRFAHPYAVVATARAALDDPWHGLPVFTAWITSPADADEDRGSPPE